MKISPMIEILLLFFIAISVVIWANNLFEPEQQSMTVNMTTQMFCNYLGYEYTSNNYDVFSKRYCYNENITDNVIFNYNMYKLWGNMKCQKLNMSFDSISEECY